MIGCLAAAGAAVAAGAGALATDTDKLRSGAVLDLVAQVPANGAEPAMVLLSVADAGTHDGASLGVRLHEPVRTREELWAAATGPSPTPATASWTVPDWRAGGDGGTEILVPVPVASPVASPGGLGAGDEAGSSSGGPRPLHIELATIDGTRIDVLRTFLLPARDGPARPADALAVAVVVDLRLPPAHVSDGGAMFDQASLNRVLDIARVLADHPGIPLTVHLSGETLDALALVGDADSLAVLRAAVHGRQLLASAWTSLDIDDWITAGRDDVVLDGLNRGREALAWAGLEASRVMRFDPMPSPAAASLVTGPDAGITGFVGSPALNTPSVRPDPVAVIADARGGHHPTAQADPLLEAALRGHDPELAAQWASAELARIGLADPGPGAVVVVVSALVADWDALNLDEGGSPRPLLVPGTDPTAVRLLLESLDDRSSLEPVTVNALLATTASGGLVADADQGRRRDRGFDLYLTERASVEERLHGYESLVGGDRAGTLTAPLRTLMAATASSYLTAGRRLELVEAVDRAIAQGAAGVEFLPRGPITVTERSADLPVTLMNHRPAAVTVALELASDTIGFFHGERSVLTLEPGRNDLLVPVEAAASGRAPIRVTVRTPDEAGAIILATGAFDVRFAGAEGIGLLILVLAGAALAAWWLQTRRKRARDADRGGATVASPDPVCDNAETSSGPGAPSTGDHEDMT